MMIYTIKNHIAKMVQIEEQKIKLLKEREENNKLI